MIFPWRRCLGAVLLHNQARKRKTGKTDGCTTPKIGKPAMASSSSLGASPAGSTPRPKDKAKIDKIDASAKKGEMELVRPVMSGPTKETKPRCELCGYTADNKKVHVYSTKDSKQFFAMKVVYDEMFRRKMTKTEALNIRDGLLKAHAD